MAKSKTKGRSRKKRKPRFSLDRGLVSVLLSILSLSLLGVALIAESFLLLAVTALSSLATVAQIRWSQKRAQDELRKKSARPPKPKGTRRPTQPTPGDGPAAGPVTNGAPVKCAETGRLIESCECASRHVATAEGARRYGLPVGSPIGRRAKKPKTPTTV